jgi:putative CRISPR-associated protein (TIGR02619 family)
MTTILTTTGISLYINARREHKTDAPTDDQMRQYLRTKPEDASAEAKSLLQMAQEEDFLVFLHTETPEAITCARLLKEFFHNRGFKHVELVQLEFQDDEKHIETRGLRNLVNKLIDEIEKARRRGQDVVINATSGFKPEIGYSTVIGMLYQVPIKYMHEKFRRLVTFNPIALDWDTSLFLNYQKFFDWLDEEPRQRKEVEQRLRALSDKESIEELLDTSDADNYIFLSPLGHVLRRQFQGETEEAKLVEWPPSTGIENIDEKISVSLLKSKHHPVKNLLSACYKIAALDCVQEIIGGFFENTTHSRLKRFNPDGTIVLLWADGSYGARLTVFTTAKGRPQTLKVANKIREILEID